MASRRSDKARAAGRLRLMEVLDRVLDRGIVCDAWVSISVSGIELVGIDAHIVVTSIETYLTHAELLRTAPPAAAPGPIGEQTSGREPDVEREPAASEAVVRAVEQYLRKIRQGEQPD